MVLSPAECYQTHFIGRSFYISDSHGALEIIMKPEDHAPTALVRYLPYLVRAAPNTPIDLRLETDRHLSKVLFIPIAKNVLALKIESANNLNLTS